MHFILEYMQCREAKMTNNILPSTKFCLWSDCRIFVMYLFIYLFLFLNFIFRTCSKSCKIITKHCNICISNMKSCSVLAKARDYIVFNSLYSHFWVSSYLYEQIGYFAIAVNNCFFLFFLDLSDVSFLLFFNFCLNFLNILFHIQPESTVHPLHYI